MALAAPRAGAGAGAGAGVSSAGVSRTQHPQAAAAGRLVPVAVARHAWSRSGGSLLSVGLSARIGSHTQARRGLLVATAAAKPPESLGASSSSGAAPAPAAPPGKPEPPGPWTELWLALPPLVRYALRATPLVAAAALLWALRRSTGTWLASLARTAAALVGSSALLTSVSPWLQGIQGLASAAVLAQIAWLLGLVAFIRVGAEPALKSVHGFLRSKGPWDKSLAHWLLRDVYGPLEVLLLVVVGCRVVEAIVAPQLGLPAVAISRITQPLLALSPIAAMFRVVLNWKAKYVGELLFEMEIEGKQGEQARIEAADKLASILATALAGVAGLQAVGFDVGSLLRVGGLGAAGAAIAGRQLLENLFAGLLLFTTQPFVVGEEIHFTYQSVFVDGIVIDVGWMRTTVRSWERELFSVPNSAIASVVVLNITRKGREWRMFKTLSLRLLDLPRIPAIVADFRKIVAKDPRVLLKLHRRIFLNGLTFDGATIYCSLYVDAPNRDAFLAIQEDLLLQFSECVQRNGGHLQDWRERVMLGPPAALTEDAKAGAVPSATAPGPGGRLPHPEPPGPADAVPAAAAARS